MSRWSIKQVPQHSNVNIEADGVNMQADGTIVFLNENKQQQKGEIIGLLLPRGFVVIKED